jgi:hypothetical protein
MPQGALRPECQLHRRVDWSMRQSPSPPSCSPLSKSSRSGSWRRDFATSKFSVPTRFIRTPLPAPGETYTCGWRRQRLKQNQFAEKRYGIAKFGLGVGTMPSGSLDLDLAESRRGSRSRGCGGGFGFDGAHGESRQPRMLPERRWYDSKCWQSPHLKFGCPGCGCSLVILWRKVTKPSICPAALANAE